MDTVIQLAAALLVTALLAYLSHRHGFNVGFLDGLNCGRAEKAQLSYHQGHEDGLYEGRLKERMEIATSQRKQYEQGYDDGHTAALDEVAEMNRQAMVGEATIRLSA